MNEFIDSLSEQAKRFVEPAKEVNRLLLNNVGELVDIQAQAFANYAEMGIAQAKSALEIRNSDSLNAFVEQQSEFSETVQAQFKGDAEKLTDLANQTAEGLKQVFSKETV
ncbi:hypothetical protein A3740_23690 [Oleiphilus sp. HI0068]|jgi:phasin family protein|nr:MULTISPECIES: phasin family protein [unclassified Oleiphilus]KZY77390.1 hypothetical protein A3740_10490 [Oleiphilus sp. HI0068]KZY85329.1 hypothetical protein A3741_02945 [Oleiphilus sp. HI0069]KZZ47034.1 hypothetical protein A3755_17000 [Oleiphilus sp. HI0085]KZY59841.1 hypothetical protein A3735_02115 [Oleiphilus sp. HI0061]KZY83171.1 hypothetical protein A3740_23690 [Oleiphilus sp. HI0068]